MIKLAGITQDSITDGPGLRFVIFTQGCPHHCPDCHNPQTWTCEGGIQYTTEQLLNELDKNPMTQGVTISGGEPFMQSPALIPFAQGVKARKLELAIYTGYTFEELTSPKEIKKFACEINHSSQKNNSHVGATGSRPFEPSPQVHPHLQLLHLCDILIDGKFDTTQKSHDLKFKGSHNQRTLDVKKSLEQNTPIPTTNTKWV